MSVGMIVLLVVVAALAGLVVWLVKAGKWAQMVTFLGEVRSELRKVSFPSRDEVIATTTVVVVFSFLISVYLSAADVLISKGLAWIFEVFS
jgi:preprotein translocase subunit SecE